MKRKAFFPLPRQILSLIFSLGSGRGSAVIKARLIHYKEC
jgi:hypothetical protein